MGASRVDWSTVVLAGIIHSAWLALTLEGHVLPKPVLFVLGGWVTAWHGSLQHEIIHGHPTRSGRVNRLLASAPLSLWLPFDLYRRSHLAHHRAEYVTDPSLDPESRYLDLDAAGPLRLLAARAQASLAARLLFGPMFEIGGSLLRDARAIGRGDRFVRAAWLEHLLLLAPVIAWLTFVCRLPLTTYLLCFVYPGAALQLLRSFAEHRAHFSPERRVAVVERAPVLGLLFLNNNLHAAHHRWPRASWSKLPALYAAHRDQLLSDNGGLVYDGYADVARRFLFRAHDRLDHAEALSGI